MTIPPDDALALRGHVLATLAIDRLAGATLGRCEGEWHTANVRGPGSYKWSHHRCTATGVRVIVRTTPVERVRCVCPRHGYQPGVTPIVTG